MKKIKGIRFIKQVPETGSCGPVSLKIVLDYFGVNKTTKVLTEMCKTTKENGTSLKNIIRAGKDLGFKVTVKDNTKISDIKRQIDKNIPVIIDWFIDFEKIGFPDGHYSVVFGYDDKYIYIADPVLGERKFLYEDFLRCWFDFEGECIKTKNDLILRRMIVVSR